MTNDYLDELTLDDLQSEEQYAIAECIGMDAYIKLARRFAGSLIYIAIPERTSACKRNEKIINDFHNGLNIKSLSIKYHLTGMQIRRAIKK